MPSSTRPRLSDEQLREIRGRTTFYRDWADNEYEAVVYGTDDRRDLMAEVDRLRAVEAAAIRVVKWATEGGQLAPWPNASGLNDLRRALEIE